MTAEYSNAVLLAILPYVSDFARRLELPVAQPVTPVQVRYFGCSPRSDHVGGRVVLTNGYEFSFDRGRIALYRSPRSYFSLQNPDRVPEYFGQLRVSKVEALEVARAALAKLGYTAARLNTDSAPEITDPPRTGDNVVPRYRIEWFAPNKVAGENRRRSVDMEVDATTKQIQMLSLLNTNTWSTNPVVNVRAPVIGTGPKTQAFGRRKIDPVSPAFSNAFLRAILPGLSEFVRKAGLAVHLPIIAEDVDLPRYVCGIVEGDPMAFVYLKNGSRFNYRHGQVIAFYAHDAWRIPGEKERKVEDFFGPDTLSTDAAVRLARETIKQLGYSPATLYLDEKPKIVPPRRFGANVFARYFVTWEDNDGELFWATVEIDASSKTIKSLFINDYASTNLWREPPQIRVVPER